MRALYLKEINQFFAGVTGYLVAVVFFVALGLFLVIAPGGQNIIYSGYASLESMFGLAPWLYLFLVPAISMRLIAEERRAGTLETLLISPLTPMRIVLAKYFAGLTLVGLTILPTLVYVGIVWVLGQPEGNLDIGGTMGSYIGLCFIAALYMAVGIFASSLTRNQIVAFIVGMALCYILYIGFDVLSQIPALAAAAPIIQQLGIDAHYASISRDVLDSRDAIYFVSLTVAFLYLTAWRCRG